MSLTKLPDDILSHIQSFVRTEKDRASWTSVNQEMIRFRQNRGWKRKIVLDYKSDFKRYITECQGHKSTLHELHLDGWGSQWILVYPKVIKITNASESIVLDPPKPVKTEVIDIVFNALTKMDATYFSYNKSKFPRLKRVLINKSTMVF